MNSVFDFCFLFSQIRNLNMQIRNRKTHMHNYTYKTKTKTNGRYGYKYPCLMDEIESDTSKYCPIEAIPFRGVNCSDAAGREIG